MNSPTFEYSQSVKKRGPSALWDVGEKSKGNTRFYRKKEGFLADTTYIHHSSNFRNGSQAIGPYFLIDNQKVKRIMICFFNLLMNFSG